MIDFGYNIDESSVIDMTKFDPTLYNQLIEVEPDILKCMACGRCTASCTAGQFTHVDLRRCILLLSRGKDKDALKEIKPCLLCGKCNLVCPRGINTRHLILSILRIYKQ